MTDEPIVTVPLSLWNEIQNEINAIRDSEDYTEMAKKIAHEKYDSSISYKDWKEAVQNECVFAIQELVPMSENVSLHCLLRLGQIAFFTPDHWNIEASND